MRGLRTAVLACITLVCAVPVYAQTSGQLAQTVSMQGPQSVLLRFQLIEANGYTEADTAIADVQNVLRELFRFRGYRLSAESVVRVTNGAEFRQGTTGADGSSYIITGSTHSIEAHAGGQSVTLSVTLWRTAAPRAGAAAGFDQELIRTSLAVPVGQTVVVGSARSSPEYPTVILVVRPEAR